MYKLTLFILTTACIAHVATQGDLFKKVREWVTMKYDKTNKFTWWFLNEIINCALCFGFWAGIVVYLAIIYNLEYLCYPLTGGISSYIIYLIIKNLKR